MPHTKESIASLTDASVKKTIGIIGGMGPEATADIFTKIIHLTPATQDSEHIHVLIDNNPMIPSRVQAIMHNGESPVPEMVRMAQSLERSGADFLIIPCNTASYYIEDIRKLVNIPVLSIVEETSKYIIDKHLDKKVIGLLGTEMTVRLGLYHKELLKHKIEVVCKDHHCNIVTEFENKARTYRRFIGLDVDKHYNVNLASNVEKSTVLSIVTPYLNSMKNLVMKAIYGKNGIKAGQKELPRKLLLKALQELEQESVKIVILGCTELPLVLQEKKVGKMLLIDPAEILAKTAIEHALGKTIF
jgi:aspartate racemase